jgi:nuclear transcription factor Y gamma
MKSDEDVRMISAEAPVLFAKVSQAHGMASGKCREQEIWNAEAFHLQACEMFILELTLRAWNHAEENKRRTLQRSDVAAAITRTDIFDFLVSTSPLLTFSY